MKKEKVVLVVIDYKNKGDWLIGDIGNELEELVESCSGKIVDKIFCRIDRPSAATIIGKGKVEEIAAVCNMQPVDTVIFSHDLKGSQQRNLEETIKVKTIDRTQLILDIFARHARTQAGKMQVELAQLEYLLPRLVGQGIALSRLGGGIGTLGPGETKLEVDRRRIGARITKLKKDLREVSTRHSLRRKKRKDRGTPLISLVGYTNAGKSTLLNRLTNANQMTKDGLFTTLSSLSRKFVLPNHQQAILSDTVGFMHDLPLHLIESFRATLEEVTEADFLLHVLDISHHNFRNLYQSVINVLKELEANEKSAIVVLNKIDKIKDQSVIKEMEQIFENAVAISAKTGEGLPRLFEKITTELSSLIINIEVMIPIKRMDLVNIAHTKGQVYSVKYYNDRIHLRAALPTHLINQFYKADLGKM